MKKCKFCKKEIKRGHYQVTFKGEVICDSCIEKKINRKTISRRRECCFCKRKGSGVMLFLVGKRYVCDECIQAVKELSKKKPNWIEIK